MQLFCSLIVSLSWLQFQNSHKPRMFLVKKANQNVLRAMFVHFENNLFKRGIQEKLLNTTSLPGLDNKK